MENNYVKAVALAALVVFAAPSLFAAEEVEVVEKKEHKAKEFINNHAFGLFIAVDIVIVLSVMYATGNLSKENLDKAVDYVIANAKNSKDYVKKVYDNNKIPVEEKVNQAVASIKGLLGPKSIPEKIKDVANDAAEVGKDVVSVVVEKASEFKEALPEVLPGVSTE